MTRDGARDFDFLHGRWRIDHRRLKEWLAGCEEWEEFTTRLECRPVLGGAGHLDEGEFPSRGPTSPRPRPGGRRRSPPTPGGPGRPTGS
ncbi:MAG TPA: hypothetical protein VIX15_12165 [Streptosporangiaceae bacterium]